MDSLNLPLRNTGVYVGHTIGGGLQEDHDYALGIEETADCLRQTAFLGNLDARGRNSLRDELIASVRGQFSRPSGDHADLSSHMAAGIISKSLGLTGPFMAVNAACASSLQALLLACRALQRGKIDMAVVGGASVCRLPWLVLFSQAQSVSATDSRPFDDRADGLVVAECYVAVVVKTLDRALADGDPIQAVIRGIGVSSDGRGRSLWAPRREGQVEAIRRAYGQGVEPADVQYLEAHATGTALGDATEIAAIAEAFDGVFPPGTRIPITSAKANLGHALEAAGLVGVLKAVLCMQKGLIPPVINVENLNTNIDWAAAPVYVPTSIVPWPTPADGRPRRAGINAFGVGGLNVHVVLDDRSEIRASVPRVIRPRDHDQDHDDEAVAVVGMGCVLPGARNVAEFRELIFSGRDPKQLAPEDRWHADEASSGASPWNPRTRPAGYIDAFAYDWRRHRIPPKHIQYADPLQFMVLQAADEALHDSGYDQKSFDRRRTGVIVGTEFAGDFTFRLQQILRLPHTCKRLRELLLRRGFASRQADVLAAEFRDAVETRWPLLSDETGSFSASSLAGRIIKTWDLMGGGAALDSGATSAAAALGAAVDLLNSEDCDMLVCVGAQRNMTAARHSSLWQDAPLADDLAIPGRPLDRNVSGLVPGEGAAVVLLKRFSDARRNGDPVRAILHRVDATHDHAVAPVRLALRQFFGRDGDPAFLMTDAAGVPQVDEPIVRTLSDWLSGTDRLGPLPVGSLVGQIGHTAGVSAAASLLAAILVLEARTVPRICGWRDPISGLIRDDPMPRCAREPEDVRSDTTDRPRFAGVLSQGKGLAYRIVVEQGGVDATKADPAK